MIGKFSEDMQSLSNIFVIQVVGSEEKSGGLQTKLIAFSYTLGIRNEGIIPIGWWDEVHPNHGWETVPTRETMAHPMAKYLSRAELQMMTI